MHKIAIQSACWFHWEDPKGTFAYIRECGFESVDLNINNLAPTAVLKKQETWQTVFDKSDAELYEHFRPLKEAVEETGVTICQMHAPFAVWFEGMEAFSDYMQFTVEQCIKVCAYVGCPALVVHPITVQDMDAQWEINMGIYRRLMPFAKQYGVKICLENLFKRFNAHIIEGCCADASEAVKYIDTLNAEAGEEVFGFCFDVGHANLIGRDIRKYLNILGHRLTVLHIHDNDGKDDLHLIPYTSAMTGGLTCDWEGFIAGLRDIGYAGEICFETFRGLSVMPRPVWDEALRLIAAIGRYFKERVEEPGNEGS